MRRKRYWLGVFVALCCAVTSPSLFAQDYGSTIISAPAGDVATLFGPGDLDQLLAPIALYPDPLLAELLPAAMNPAEIVQADRYLQSGGDPNQVDFQPWSQAVKAMAHYPGLLRWMDDNIAWTTQAGQAFRNQYQDVMNSIQRLRAQAQSLGNLQSTPQQNVIVDSGVVEIVPANPEVIYVPTYDPTIVFHRHAMFGTPFITFGLGLSIGAWLDRDWDWHHHQVIVWDRSHFRPRDWWYRPMPERFRPSRDFRVWHPRAPQHVWRPEDRGYDVRHEPVHVEAPRPREVVRTEPSRHETVRVEPARPEERREPARVESRSESRRQPEPNRQPERVERRAPEPQPTRTPAPAPTPAPRPNGALVGVRSAPETRAYSNRGQQSRAVQNGPTRSPNESRRDRH
jgi:hypothetical protein